MEALPTVIKCLLRLPHKFTDGERRQMGYMTRRSSPEILNYRKLLKRKGAEMHFFCRKSTFCNRNLEPKKYP